MGRSQCSTYVLAEQQDLRLTVYGTPARQPISGGGNIKQHSDQGVDDTPVGQDKRGAGGEWAWAAVPL